MIDKNLLYNVLHNIGIKKLRSTATMNAYYLQGESAIDARKEIDYQISRQFAEEIMKDIVIKEEPMDMYGDKLFHAEMLQLTSIDQLIKIIETYEHLSKQRIFDEQIREYQLKQAFKHESNFGHFLGKITEYHEKQEKKNEKETD